MSTVPREPVPPDPLAPAADAYASVTVTFAQPEAVAAAAWDGVIPTSIEFADSAPRGWGFANTGVDPVFGASLRVWEHLKSDAAGDPDSAPPGGRLLALHAALGALGAPGTLEAASAYVSRSHPTAWLTARATAAAQCWRTGWAVDDGRDVPVKTRTWLPAEAGIPDASAVRERFSHIAPLRQDPDKATLVVSSGPLPPTNDQYVVDNIIDLQPTGLTCTFLAPHWSPFVAGWAIERTAAALRSAGQRDDLLITATPVDRRR